MPRPVRLYAGVWVPVKTRAEFVSAGPSEVPIAKPILRNVAWYSKVWEDPRPMPLLPGLEFLEDPAIIIISIHVKHNAFVSDIEQGQAGCVLSDDVTQGSA